MEHVRWSSRPALHRPALVTAFAGWNDAGDAATTAVRYFADQWDAECFAEIDPDEFYDFTETWPRVHQADGAVRHIEWPGVELLAANIAGTSSDDAVGDLILLVGTEPQLRWRTFCAEITQLAIELGVGRVIHLGALLAEIPHSRPVPVTASGTNLEVLEAERLPTSHYEGPTGIVGVLHQACNEAGLDSLSVWAAVPTYVSGAPSPKAALALAERTARLLRVDLTTGLLEVAARVYEQEVDTLVADDDDTADYVRRLERDFDEEADDDDVLPGKDLTAEIERFLREQHPDH